MTADDVLTRAAPPPDFMVSYGPGDDQVADVRLPASAVWSSSAAGSSSAPGSSSPALSAQPGASSERSSPAQPSLAPQPGMPVSLGLPAQPSTSAQADVRAQSARLRPAPLVLFLHGGFWRAAYDRAHTGPLAAALAAAGFAVCVPEFRRSGQPGGGWPGTFDDVAAAVDVLPALARDAAGTDV